MVVLFANIPQANQFTHTQATSYSYTGGNAIITPGGGHTFNVNDQVTLAFSSAFFSPQVPRALTMAPTRLRR